MTSPQPPVRWRGTVAYDGTPYQGWQRQPAGRPTVQGTLDQALSLLEGRPVRTTGASRTDTGVHAAGQVCHADLTRQADGPWWRRRLNRLLPESIRVYAWEEARPDFHARKAALGKTYAYDLSWTPASVPLTSGWRPWELPASPDLDRLRWALSALRQQADWSSFTSEATPPLRTLTGLWLIRQPSKVRMVVQGPGFHYQQVRRMVRAATLTACGRLTEPAFEALLMRPRRNAQEQPAPPYGLLLVGVHYEPAALGQLPALALEGWWSDPRFAEVTEL